MEQKIDKYLDYYCKSGEIQYLRYINDGTKSFLIPAAKLTLDVYDNNKASIYYKRATEILDTFTRTPKHGSCDTTFLSLYNLFENTGQSCYLDSVLVALYAVPNKFIDDNTIDANIEEEKANALGKWECGDTSRENLSSKEYIQSQLKFTIEKLRGYRDTRMLLCTDLRRALKLCPYTRKYSGTGQEDAGEFLSHLLQVFSRTNQSVKETATYITNDISESNTDNMIKLKPVYDKKASIIWFTDGIELSLMPKRIIDIRQFLIKREDSGQLSSNNLYKHTDGQTYQRRVGETTLVSAPYIIFSIQRRNPITDKKIFTKIYPAEVITLPKSGQHFYLSAIVVHKGGEGGGHYVCYFLCGDTWMFYDDVGRVLKTVGKFVDILNAGEIMTEGTLYFYVPF